MNMWHPHDLSPARMTNLIALDLALAPIHGPSRQPPAATAEHPLSIPLHRLEPVANPQGSSEGASTQRSSFFRDVASGGIYRLKLNQNRPANTLHEVFCAHLIAAMGFECAPRTLFIAEGSDDANNVRIGSPLVEGFLDLGEFLLERGVDHVPSAAEQDRYQQFLRAYAQEQETIKGHVARLHDLLSAYPKGGYDRLSPAEHGRLQPLRDAYRRQIERQQGMLDLLPTPFHQTLRHAFYVSEIVGNWDFLNHDFANTGFVVGAKGVRVHTVDFGNAGAMGFGGLSKQANGRHPNVPARIDDPYGRIPGGVIGYQPQLHADKECAPLGVRPLTFGAIGQIPRSMVFAHLHADVVSGEREASGQHPPAEALAIAYRLKFLDHDFSRQFITRFFETVRANPDRAIRALADCAHVSEAELIRGLEGRIRDIVQRAQAHGELARWERKHPEVAIAIRNGYSAGAEAGPVPGVMRSRL
jgi:hypothetical protein